MQIICRAPYRVHVEAPVDEGEAEPLGAPGNCGNNEGFKHLEFVQSFAVVSTKRIGQQVLLLLITLLTFRNYFHQMISQVKVKNDIICISINTLNKNGNHYIV